jgi:GNAT superfamily N-acetyltransferase
VPVTTPHSFQIRRAVPGEAEALTALCRAAKRHWGYPEEWMAAWANAVRVTPQAIREEKIFVARRGEEGARLGFFGLRRDGTEWWLEHFWIAPEHIGRGLGRALFATALAEARRLAVTRVRIKSDPNAEGFYLRMGARRVGEECYLLLGQHRRVLPLLLVDVPAVQIGESEWPSWRVTRADRFSR